MGDDMGKAGNFLMGVIDIGLLAVILTSYQDQKQTAAYDAASTSESVISQNSVYSESSVPEQSSESENPSVPEQSSESETPSVPELASENANAAPEQLSENIVESVGRDYDTSEKPAAGDFEWVTTDILQGFVPDDAEPLDFDEAAGGWKAYIVTDPDNAENAKVEQYLNAYIGGSESDVTVLLDWYYSYVYSMEEGYDDPSPDSQFTGSWENNGIQALGPGRLDILMFYCNKDREYAVGTIMWPDGMNGVITLVRP